MSSPQTPLKRLYTYIAPMRWALGLIVLLSVGVALTEAGFTALMKPLLDRGFSGKASQYVWLMPLGIIFIFVVRGVMTFITSYLVQWLTQTALAQLRRDMFAKLLQLPDATFKQERSAAMMVKFTTDAANALGSLSELAITSLRDGFLIIALTGWLLVLNWKLSIIVFTVVPATAFITQLISKRLTVLAHGLQASNAAMLQVVKEAVAAQRMVKLHSAYDAETARFETLVAKMRRLVMRSVMASAATMPLTQLLASLGVAVLVALAIYQSQASASDPTQQALTVGAFVSFLMGMLQLLTPLKHLANLNGPYARTLAAAQSVFDFLDQADERLDTGTQPMPAAPLSIRVENLTHHYAGNDVPALNGVSLNLLAGQTTTLIGRSGSGKSTLAALLPRFIDASHGAISINGVPLASIRLADLRARIAMVTQEALLVDDTIAANIAYGDAAPDEARMWAALEAASMAATVRSLPLGLATQVGESGSRFSGGQRQRLTIARAFYKNAPILILDEATSALDVESEAHIQSALKTLMQGRTTLVVTHRLNTIAPDSHVVVLEAGKVVMQGNHAAMLKENAEYASLVNTHISQ